MMLCAVTVVPMTVTAQKTDIADDGANLDIAQTGNPYENYKYATDPNGYWANCTYWAWQYAYEYDGVALPTWGDARYWYGGASGTYPCDKTPSAHSIMCTGSGTYGHVAYVTDYDSANGRVYIKQGGWRYSSDGRDERWVSAYPSDLQGYIHLAGNPDPNPQGYVMSEAEGAGRTIPDGDYWIISKIAEDYFIDIPGNDFNTYNEQNVQTWRWDSGLPPVYDVFHFSYLNNGFYKITQLNTNMAIDVYGGYLERGSNVSMWSYTGSVAQQWSIEKTDGGYKIRSGCNNYYMDIYDGKHENGTNILTWENNNGNNQLFSFIPYAPDEKPVSNGNYKIVSAVNDTCYLDIKGGPDFHNKDNIQIYNFPDEKFRVEYVGNGYYLVSEANSNFVMEVNNDGEYSYLSNSRNVIVYEKNNRKNQFWKIKKNSDGTYSFINKLSGYYLDLENSKTDSGTNVSQYQYNGGKNQKWKLRRVIDNEMVTVSDVVLNNNSEAVNPQITVKVDNTILKADTDYTVTIETDATQEKGTVTITGINNYCGTVTKSFSITVIAQSEPTSPPTEPSIIKLGDVDGDGEVTIFDATAIQRWLADLPASQINETAADADEDGEISIFDATAVQRWLADLPSNANLGKPIT